MLTPTHIVTAQTAYLGGCLAVGHPPTIPEALAAIAAGIAPDLDHRQGLVGRYVPVISGPLEHWFGHRTFTHSLILQLAVLIPAFLWLPFGYALALLAGLVSHSVADMMTESGVCWFWPSRARCVLPGNDRYRVSLLSWGELSFLVVITGAGLGFQALAQLNAGTAGLIRTAIGSIAAAREQYDAEKGATAYRLRIEGRDNQTYATLKGEYPVVGEWQSAGFLVQADSRMVTVCQAATCDWYAEKAVLVEGNPKHTTTTTVELEQVAVVELREALSAAKSAGEVRVVGTAISQSIKAAPPAVAASGERITLHYAPAEALDAWPEVMLRKVRLTVQVRHDPEIQPPPIEVTGESVAELDPLLGKWL